MPASSAAATPRSDIIDAFRGLAILAVLAFHFLFRWAPPRAPTNLYGYDATYLWPSFGWAGVQLFFVISGLVITMTLLRSVSAADFAARRIARIYPAFLAASVIIALALLLHDPLGWKVGWRDFLLTLTLLPQNLGKWQLVDGAFWSLTVEARFYFFVALAFALLKRRFWWGLLVVAAAGNALWLLSPVLGNGLFLARSLPPFLIGVGLWFLVFEHRIAPALTCLTVGLAAYGLHVAELSNRFGPSLIAHGFVLGGAALLALLIWRGASLKLGPLAWVGRISYSLYLYHQKLGVTLIHDLKRAGAPDLLAAGVAAAAVILIAWASFHWIEQPGQKWAMALYRAGAARWRGRGKPG